MDPSNQMKQAAKKVLSPALSYTDGQFAALQQRLHDLQADVERLEQHVAADTQTVAELAVSFGRSNHRLTEEFAALADLAPGVADRMVAHLTGTDVAEMGPGTAEFLNWAVGHTGPAAQATVWFNPPVTVLHDDGTVKANEVTERIVEVPYAFGAAAALDPGSLVLDFGATESTVALSLASLGLDVLASDLRSYPLEHPRLTSVVGPIEEWKGPDRPLDAVFCISALEHAGLGAYGEEAAASNLDRVILEAFGRWLRPGGEVVFTAPYGLWQVDHLQRVYDAEHLDALFSGWTLNDRRICVQTGPATWEMLSEEPPTSAWEDGRRGVVLLRATPAG